MAQLKVDERSLAKLKNIVRDQILVPKLNEISRGVRKDISNTAEKYRGASVPSMADIGATTTIKDRRSTKYRVQPIPGTEHTFKINLEGYQADQWFDIDRTPGLRAWVDKKIPNYGANRLKVRGKGSSGSPAPLGSPDRDMFGIAFKNLIGRDRTKYGLK